MLTVVSGLPAVAYVQDRELEAALRRSDPEALALFPAKGFRDGAAGFFKTHELHVVPGSERAWCQEQGRAVLPAGCYVEFVFQGKGLKERTSQGDFCGRIGRWIRAPGSKNYVPTPGAFYSQAIAYDDAEVVYDAIYENDKPECR
jgi:hypothetical protein